MMMTKIRIRYAYKQIAEIEQNTSTSIVYLLHHQRPRLLQVREQHRVFSRRALWVAHTVFGRQMRPHNDGPMAAEGCSQLRVGAVVCDNQVVALAEYGKVQQRINSVSVTRIAACMGNYDLP